ncbi:hypothetical protein ACODT3_01275 [Streptomyces sp. 4.24]|uniref:hypothetical protein n=1 Tax=Streptomyces tritrimontium TaxID=3406573 RepID=UPI003BB71659
MLKDIASGAAYEQTEQGPAALRQAGRVVTGKEAELPAQRLLRFTTMVTAEKGPSGRLIIEDRMQTQSC